MGTSVSSILTVTTPALGVAPGPAISLSASSITTTSLILTWTAPTIGSLPLSYVVQTAPVGSSTFTAISGSLAVTSFSVSGLAPNTSQQYRVLTSNSTGNSLSTAITATTLPIAPSAPTGLAVVGSPGQNDISLQWNAPESGTIPFTYQVSYRTPSGSGVYTPFASTTPNTTQDITGLTAGSGYDLQVTATNLAGTGPVSAALINVQTLGIIVNPPGPATALVFSNVGTTTLTLSWTAPTSGSTPFTYQPQVSSSGSGFANIGSSIPVTTASFSGLTPNTTYLFQVVTSNSTPQTSTSASASTTTLSVIPAAPTGLATTGTATTSAISLQWVAPATGTAPFTYQVLSRTPTGVGSFANAAASTLNLTQTITGLAAAHGYDFEVTATNLAGTGPASAVLVNAQTAVGAPDPAPATALVVTNLAATTLTLSWTAPASGTTPFTYQVQQSSGGGGFANIGGSVSPTTEDLTGLTPNTVYQFQVVTTNFLSATSTSSTVSATTPAQLPGAPTALALVGSPTTTSLSLSWVAPVTGTAPFTYQVLSRTPTGVGGYASAGAAVSGPTAALTGLTPSTSYDFEVEALNAAGTGPVSTALVNVVTAAVAPPVAPSAPINLTAGTITSTTIQVSWAAPSTGTPPLSYVVQWRTH